ncbi:GNAT family N-acetyltransferase [Spirillospora sp. NPDC029432]|uniref:GNAT family N-acetyltransferase n=1 Tax=Spirillospora sp. NPDC029432 TaxID=3154599 RepID=UPI0034556E2F
MADVVVREAEGADVARAARTLREAFADYPFTRHVIAEDDHLGRLERFQELFVARVGLPYGKVWVEDDVRAVAVWTTPETPPDVLGELVPRFAELAGDRLEAYEAAEAVMAAQRPEGPVWFLGTVGVDPAAQGLGLGAAVVRPGIEAAERAGVPAFLETSEGRNVKFYQRLGFEVVSEYDLPDGGPRTWSMIRR